MLGWGIGLASHLLAVALPDEEKLRRRVARQRERESWRAPPVRVGAQTDAKQRSGGRVRVEAAGSEEDASETDAAHLDDDIDRSLPREKGSRRG